MTSDRWQADPVVDGGAGDFAVYDHPLLRREYLLPGESQRADGTAKQQAVLQLDGIRCAGCCAGIEKKINALHGVSHAEINYTTHQLRVGWRDGDTTLGTIMQVLDQLGYAARPVSVDSHTGGPTAGVAAQRDRLIRQLGIAAALGMQVMVLSVCLYAGHWWGIEPGLERFFRYLSLLLTLPLLLYSGQTFLLGAWSDLRRARIGMDVPVALGLSIAFLASVHALATGRGETYFDSICMFVLLVLGARLIELDARLRAMSAVSRFDAVLPVSAQRLSDGKLQRVPVAALAVADHIHLDAGEVVPADGVIVTGASSFDESLLTGESAPVARGAGDAVVAGALNVGHPVAMTITGVGEQTRFSAIAQLVRRAQFGKPSVNRMVEQLARWFVLVVLCIAAGVALRGWLLDSADALSATIAVLIVSCPCALALATPAALSMAMNRALARGMMVTNPAALETLARAERFFFDKTGTLTSGDFVVTQVQPFGDASRAKIIQLAKSLERYSAHPLATALQNLAGDAPLPVSDIDTSDSDGLSATIDRRRYYIGSAAYVERKTGHAAEYPAAAQTLVVLADDDGLLGVFCCADQIRSGAAELIAQLRRDGGRIAILSGDRPEAVARVAAELGIEEYHAACTPEDKLAHVARAVDEGAVTAMLGDGVNDAPVVSAAHVSIALAERVNLTATHADVVALNSNLRGVGELLTLARRLNRTIAQNLAWALGYNALAIPFAAVGLVPPWLAAIGMSASSLIVVLNASRLGGSASVRRDS